MVNPDALQRFLGRLTFAQGPLLPSHWMARGLEAAARGDIAGAVYPLALVWSNGLFLYVLAAWTARRFYRHSYNRLWTGGTLRRRYGGHWLDHALTTTISFLHPQTRLLIIKDFRTFRRDPAQWAQVLIFVGLLMFYSVNTRRFYQRDISRVYQNGVSLLNLTATAFLMCAYTGRFVYPMLSLEGRKFWILGLLPLRRERLLWGEFAFSATGALVIAELLVILSDLLAGHDLAGARSTRCDRGGAGSGSEWLKRGSGSVYAELSGERSFENRCRFWRHLEPGSGAALLALGDRTDGSPLPPAAPPPARISVPRSMCPSAGFCCVWEPVWHSASLPSSFLCAWESCALRRMEF